MNLDIRNAREEVLTKTDADLELETAVKWAGRSIACYKLFDSTNDMKWLLRAESYYQEALEHAALVRDEGESLREVEAAMTEELER